MLDTERLLEILSILLGVVSLIMWGVFFVTKDVVDGFTATLLVILFTKTSIQLEIEELKKKRG